MRARGAIEDAAVTPEFEHVLATMEAMHEDELRRVRDKYEAEMATFKRFANDREGETAQAVFCLLYTSPSPRDGLLSRMPSSA